MKVIRWSSFFFFLIERGIFFVPNSERWLIVRRKVLKVNIKVNIEGKLKINSKLYISRRAQSKYLPEFIKENIVVH